MKLNSKTFNWLITYKINNLFLLEFKTLFINVPNLATKTNVFNKNKKDVRSSINVK